MAGWGYSIITREGQPRYKELRVLMMSVNGGSVGPGLQYPQCGLYPGWNYGYAHGAPFSIGLIASLDGIFFCNSNQFGLWRRICGTWELCPLEDVVRVLVTTKSDRTEVGQNLMITNCSKILLWRFFNTWSTVLKSRKSWQWAKISVTQRTFSRKVAGELTIAFHAVRHTFHVATVLAAVTLPLVDDTVLVITTRVR